MNALQDIIWTEIIDPIWHEQNDIKNGKTGVHDEKEAETLNNKMKWLIDYQYEVLNYGDRFMAGTDVSMLLTMRTATKKRWLRHLELAREINEREQKQTGGGQKQITQFF